MLVSLKRRPWAWAALIAAIAVVFVLAIDDRPESLTVVVSARFPSVDWVDTKTLADWMERPDEPVLLDVRRPDEFAVSHLRGARRVDPKRPSIESLGIGPDERIVVYCAVGYRSGAIAEKLEAAGYHHVYNLKGGIFAWANEGRPVFDADGPARAVHPYDGLWGTFLRSDLRARPSTSN